MTKNGFYIRQICVAGEGKESAKVEFEKGLNVVSGLSDSGKTFIYECINYMFGKDFKLPTFKENNHYDTIFMELATYEGDIYTLKRGITEDPKKIFIVKEAIDKVNEHSGWRKYGITHSKDRSSNISRFLLNLMGLSEVVWLRKKKDKPELSSLSFRELSYFIMVDEVRIIEKGGTPVLKANDYLNWTKYKAIFKFLLTGNDDSEFGEKKKKQLGHIKIRNQLSLLETLIEEIEAELVGYILANSPRNIDDLENKLELLEKVDGELQEAYDKKKNYQKEIETLKGNWDKTNLTIKRFSILNEQYVVELQRLEFIHEGEYILSQLNNVQCPLCSSLNDNTDFLYEEEFFRNSLQREYEKIKILLRDLDESIKVLNEDSEKLENEIQELEQINSENNLKIQNILIPKINNLKNDIDNIILYKEISAKRDTLQNEAGKLNNRKILLESKLEEVDTSNETFNDVDENICEGLLDEVKKLLKEWNFKEDIHSIFDEDVRFDYSAYDLIISQKLRSDFGKGYRAVIYASFLIALMNYTIKNGLYHTGMVIIDSPFTALSEEEDDSKVPAEEKVSIGMRESFYRNLALNVKNEQIIVFENAAPNNEYGINHIHFTKNKRIGRYGFFKV